jgi:sensor histidine kinase YesM
MVAHYLAIMQARLGDRLRWRVDMAPECATQLLPSGLVITLVENAVEHGIEPQLRGGEVSLVARIEGATFELRVLDDGAGLPPGDVHDGVGLANSRERLRHQFGARAELQLSPRDDGPGAQVCLRVHAPDRPG